MTVSELIETLKAHPGDLRVVVNGYEEGYDDLSPRQISVLPIALDTGVEDWEGRHGEPGDTPGRRCGAHEGRRRGRSAPRVELILRVAS